MRVSLTPLLEAFVKEKVDTGAYNDASEVVREALRLMREHEDLARLKLGHLRDALAKGEADIASGRCTTLSGDDELNDFFARL